MKLETTLADISQKLKEGRFSNEQSISQGVVLRVLDELNWEVYDTNIVWPEFKTGEGRVDFALCDPPSKPKCFVEVKQPGKAENGVRQALEYAFHSGVPFVVLTDGQTWSFYLPAEQGSYEERRVFKCDLFERTGDEAAEALQHYLERGRVASGEALDAARNEYRSKSRRLVARKTIPEAWKELVERCDDLLRDLLVDAVESKAGFRPDNADVTDFLASLRLPDSPSDTLSVRPPSPKRRDDPKPPIPSPGNVVIVLGKEIPYKNAKEAMVFVFSELARRDPAFLEHCSRDKAFHGRTRHYIARRIEDLYLESPHLQGAHEELPGKWFVGTHLSNQGKMGLIKAATRVAGLTFGRDVIVDL